MIKTTIFIIVLFIKFFRNRFAAIPGIIYAIVYTVFAILLSEENGGWTDFYKINAGYVPIILEVLAAIIIFFGIPTLLRL